MNDFLAGAFTTIGLLFVMGGYQVSKKPMCSIPATLMIFFGLRVVAVGVFLLVGN